MRKALALALVLTLAACSSEPDEPDATTMGDEDLGDGDGGADDSTPDLPELSDVPPTVGTWCVVFPHNGGCNVQIGDCDDGYLDPCADDYFGNNVCVHTSLLDGEQTSPECGPKSDDVATEPCSGDFVNVCEASCELGEWGWLCSLD